MPQRPISRAQAALLVAGVALLLDPSRLSANEGAADPGVFETGPYAFSDELGGFHILSARGSGTIFNISSVSDRKTAPVAVTYTATKYAVRALSESLREAEGKNGVRVINVAPGYVRTNIHAGMGISFDEYRKALGNPDFLSAEELADVVLYCWKLPPHICIRDIVVTPTRTTF